MARNETGARSDPNVSGRAAHSQFVLISSLIEEGVGGDVGLLQSAEAPSTVRLCWEYQNPTGPRGRNRQVSDCGGFASSLQGLKDTCQAGVFCGFFLLEGDVFVYVGRNKNLKDLED